MFACSWWLIEMSRFSLDNNNFPYDNNVLVLDMVLGSLWGISQPINWDNVAKLVPGFTPNEVPTSTSAWFGSELWRKWRHWLAPALSSLQCAQRFEELKLTGGFPLVDHQCNTVADRGSSTPSDSVSTQPEPGGAVDTGGSRGTGQCLETSTVVTVLDYRWKDCRMPALIFHWLLHRRRLNV